MSQGPAKPTVSIDDSSVYIHRDRSGFGGAMMFFAASASEAGRALDQIDHAIHLAYEAGFRAGALQAAGIPPVGARLVTTGSDSMVIMFTGRAKNLIAVAEFFNCNGQPSSAGAGRASVAPAKPNPEIHCAIEEGSHYLTMETSRGVYRTIDLGDEESAKNAQEIILDAFAYALASGARPAAPRQPPSPSTVQSPPESPPQPEKPRPAPSEIRPEAFAHVAEVVALLAPVEGMLRERSNISPNMRSHSELSTILGVARARATLAVAEAVAEVDHTLANGFSVLDERLRELSATTKEGFERTNRNIIDVETRTEEVRERLRELSNRLR